MTTDTNEPPFRERVAKSNSQNAYLQNAGVPGADSDSSSPDEADPGWQDRASSVAFGGQSSADAAEQTNDNGSLPLLIAFVGLILAIGALRSWWFPGIVAGLLFMLFMHEFGHYLTARASGMKVTEFFLGFGPKIWSFNRGETEYGVKGLPLGAYVRIMGMTNLDEIDPAEEHRTYRAQPYWQRMMTICAGSAMHFLMAFVGLVVLFGAFSYQGFNGPPWFVDQVVPESTADQIGIQSGDRIVSVNGDGFANWDEFGDVVTSIEPGPMSVVVERSGERFTLSGELGPRPKDVLLDGFGLILIDEDELAGWQVGYVWPQDKAEQFGLEVGDVVERAGDVDRPTEFSLARLLTASEGEPITFDVMRDGERISLAGAIELNDTPFRGFFGVGPQFVRQPEPGLLSSMSSAADDFGVVTKTNIVGIADLINPARWLGFSDDNEVERRAALIPAGTSTPLPQPDDPSNRPLSMIGIGRLIADSESADQVIFLFVIVNIFIGIFNLAPVLPLDGGHAAIATYERVRGLIAGERHRVDAAKLIPLTWAVILVLVGVGVWTMALDIFSWPV